MKAGESLSEALEKVGGPLEGGRWHLPLTTKTGADPRIFDFQLSPLYFFDSL